MKYETKMAAERMSRMGIRIRAPPKREA